MRVPSCRWAGSPTSTLTFSTGVAEEVTVGPPRTEDDGVSAEIRPLGGRDRVMTPDTPILQHGV